MPSGQYFYSNPQAAAIANNLAKVFFGDAEKRAEQERMNGIMLENQLRQQQIDENNTVNDARGSISRLFGTMSPQDIQKNAPQFYSEFARLAGRDGFGANDGSTLIRGFAANAGGDDNTIARAFAGAGNALNQNEGVSIGDRNAIQTRNNAVDYYNINEREKGADRRMQVTVNKPGETVYVPGADGGPRAYTASDAAIDDFIKTNQDKGAKSGAGINVTPSASARMDEMIGDTFPGIEGQDRLNLLVRATELYRTNGDAAKAIQQAGAEMTETTETPRWWGLGTPKKSSKMKEGAGISEAFAPTDDAATAINNGLPSEQATKVVQSLTDAQTGAPPEAAFSAGPTEVIGPAPGQPEGRTIRNKTTGEVRKVVNGNWVRVGNGAR
jgi:hypothetical protein